MEHLTIKTYLLSKPEANEQFPFGPDVSVFKIKNHKMFATLAFGHGNEKGTQGKMTGHWCMNLKCDPQQADALRSIFPAVIPGYHMNKIHWNTILLDGSIPQNEIERMIDHSYTLIAKSLTKSERELLELHYPKDILYR